MMARIRMHPKEFDHYGAMASRHVCGIPVVIGADVHRSKRATDPYERALNLLKVAGYREMRII